MKVILLVFAFTLASCSTDNAELATDEANDTAIIEDLSVTIPYAQIDGVAPDLLSLDVYYTSEVTRKKPVVIWVHGGAWSVGDKANAIEDKVRLFRAQDYLLVSVNYRLSPFPLAVNDPDRIMYPTHNKDVAMAIRWVFDTIDTYGGDPNTIALLGHSAGAHLVALTGTNTSFLEEVGLNLSHIKGIAAIDTEGYDVVAKIASNSLIYRNAFGTDANANREASPRFNINSDATYPKFFIGKRGGAARQTIADDFITTLEANGTLVSQIDGSIYDHEGINAAIGQDGELVITEPLLTFFKNCFDGQ